jgi:hypothetical protein
MSVCYRHVIFGGCTGNLDDVETFIVVRNLKKIPGIVVSGSDLRAEKRVHRLRSGGLHSKILQRLVHLDKIAREAKMRLRAVKPR